MIVPRWMSNMRIAMIRFAAAPSYLWAIENTGDAVCATMFEMCHTAHASTSLHFTAVPIYLISHDRHLMFRRCKCDDNS